MNTISNFLPSIVNHSFLAYEGQRRKKNRKKREEKKKKKSRNILDMKME